MGSAACNSSTGANWPTLSPKPTGKIAADGIASMARMSGKARVLMISLKWESTTKMFPDWQKTPTAWMPFRKWTAKR
eukprot:4827274-Alexandrium_andersonii.AAC.1